MKKKLNILWISTAYGVYSESNPEFVHGGVTDYLRLMLKGLAELGHRQLILLPTDSDSFWPHIVFQGTSQPTLAKGTLDAPVYPQTGSCLEKMMDYAWAHQDAYDIIINAGHDWLPHFMAGMFKTPYLSLPNLCHTVPQLDALIHKKSFLHPGQIAFFSKAQKNLLGSPDCAVLRQPFEIEDFCATNNPTKPEYLFWAGRVTPEKGVESALKFANEVDLPLKVAGVVEAPYLEYLKDNYSKTLNYLGLMPRQEMFKQMRDARAFLQMQRSDWQEAFGRVTVEAMLCGCPVIYTQSGANEELVDSCKAGVLFENITPKQALDLASSLDRSAIQQAAFDQYSTTAVATELEALAYKLTNNN